MRVPAAALACLIVLAAVGPAAADGPAAPRLLAPEHWANDNLAVGYIGHATVLLKLSGTFVLTDPAFSDRIGVSLGPITVGPHRIVAPALALDRLPALAAVVISHAHFDSLDLPTLRALDKDTTLIAPPRCDDLLADLGFRRYVELAWGEQLAVDGLTIEAVPVKHWGKRVPWGRDRGYNGYLFSKDGHRVLFAPDTAYTDLFARYGRDDTPLDLAVLGNGAYDPWIRNHASPEQVWQMFLASGARRLAPIHWDTFRLGKEPVGDSMLRLLAAAGSDSDRIVIRQIGGEWSLPHHVRE